MLMADSYGRFSAQYICPEESTENLLGLPITKGSHAAEPSIGPGRGRGGSQCPGEKGLDELDFVPFSVCDITTPKLNPVGMKNIPAVVQPIFIKCLVNQVWYTNSFEK